MINLTDRKTTPYNSTYKKLAVQCSADRFVVNQTLALRVNICGENRQLLLAAKRYLPTNGLVGYWPFNNNANDESGNGNNGTVNGATLTTDRFGSSNSAYLFDGIDDFIRAYQLFQIFTQ